MDVDALHRDAQLPGIGEARAYRGLSSLGRVDVGTHDHGVLAAQLEGALDEALRAPLGDDAARGGGAREHHVVRGIDDEGAGHGAFARHDGHEPVGQAREKELLQHPRGDEGRLGIRLQQHAIARKERGHRVACRKGERVVPRRDDADEADRLAEFLDPHQHGQGSAHTTRAEELGGVACVVLGHDGDIEDLLERISPRLAYLPLQQVECLIALRDDEVMESPHDAHPIAHRALRPFTLHGARPRCRALHVVLGGEGQAVEHVAGEGRVDVARLGIGRDSETGYEGRGCGRRRQDGHAARLRANEGVAVGVRCDLCCHACLVPAQEGGDEGSDGGGRSPTVVGRLRRDPQPPHEDILKV